MGQFNSFFWILFTGAAWLDLGLGLVALILGAALFWSLHVKSQLQRQLDASVRETDRLRQEFLQQKQAEHSCAQSAERYRSLVENAADGICVIDPPTGEFRFLNHRGRELFGFTAEEAPGPSLWDIVAHEERESLQASLRALAEGRPAGTPSHRYTFSRKDGARLRVDTSAHLITFDGQPAIQAVMHDVSGQERLQQTLQHTQKMEAISTLAGGIAHQFNNLLMGIQGNVSLMLLDTNFGVLHMDKLRNIELGIQRGAELTRQLLGFARSGKFQVKPSEINKILARTIDIYWRTKKEVHIHPRYQVAAWVVEIDQLQIEQVLLNLFINAWQAMPEGGDLYLETENAYLEADAVKAYNLKPGPFVRIGITDSGVGMDAETCRRVFEPFFTTRQAGQGAGLGLAAAYGIIQNHGGFIEVTSEPGAGSSFQVYLPASDKSIPVELPPLEDFLKGTETILIVDDEEIVLNVGRQILEKMGYQVLVADSGLAAVERFKEQAGRIALVVLDVVMPGMDGVETCRALRDIQPDAKILFSSGYNLNGHLEDLAGINYDGFIQKPFSLPQLSVKIREILDAAAPGA